MWYFDACLEQDLSFQMKLIWLKSVIPTKIYDGQNIELKTAWSHFSIEMYTSMIFPVGLDRAEFYGSLFLVDFDQMKFILKLESTPDTQL